MLASWKRLLRFFIRHDLARSGVRVGVRAAASDYFTHNKRPTQWKNNPKFQLCIKSFLEKVRNEAIICPPA